MSWFLDLIGAVAIGAAAVLFAASTVLFAASTVHAQEAPATHLPTIADCPAGWTLGVQDMAAPQPLAKTTSQLTDPNSYSVDGAMVAYKASQDAPTAEQQAAAPRQFVTGCVPPQPPAQNNP